MIEIKNMETTYGNGDTFRVREAGFHRGEITSVIGRNGCGKTTLLRTIAGLMPYSGTITIDQKECRMYSRRERALKVSYLPQIVKPVSMDVLTLVEHGRFPWHGNYRRLNGEDKYQVETALELTHMSSFRRRELTELSGGELRRAYLAMAIAQNADMLLLDEPTTYMDIRSQDLFLEIIGKLAKKGHGILMTCHNIEQGFSCSDHIVIMDSRTVRKTGNAEELMQEEQTLREIFGASVKRSDDAAMLYPYVLTK